MPLDPDAASFLEIRNRKNLPPPHLQTPQEFRKSFDAGPFSEGPPIFEVNPFTIPAESTSPPVLARIYRPSLGSHLPTLLFIHGGGWMVGTLDFADGTMRHMAQRSGHLIVSVTYRKAPDNKFPAALDDCFRASEWLAHNVHALGGDPTRLTIGGSSAGANLAAGVTLMRRDRNLLPYRGQLLVVPCLDPACESKSFQEHATGCGLTTATMRWFWQNYLRDEDDRNSPYAAPLLASSLAGLPSSLIITAEFDPLRDDGYRYSKALKKAGVPVRYEEYPGMIHYFFGQPGIFSSGLVAIDRAAAWLAELNRS